MKSMIHLLLLFTLLTSTTASVHRRLDDRHSDPPDQYDVPNGPPTPKPSIDPSAVPSVLPSITMSNIPSGAPSENPSLSPSNLHSKIPSTSPSFLPSDIPSASPSFLPSDVPSTSPSLLPSDVPSTSPSLLPSKASSPSPSLSHKPSEKVSCKTDSSGFFGRTTDTRVDVPFYYEMEVKQDYNDDITALEREMSEMLVRSICRPDKKSLKELNIVGVSTGIIDEPIGECKIEKNKSTDCFLVKGGLSVYIDDSGKRNKKTDVADSVRDIMKSSIDNGEIKVTSIGITSTSWVTTAERRIIDDEEKDDGFDWLIVIRILVFLVLLCPVVLCCFVADSKSRDKKEESTNGVECDDTNEA